MRKKKRHHDEHVDESWLIPYADMLTLLLALFIVLFAVSSIDAEKYQQMMISFNESFQGGTGIMENLSPIPTNSTSETDNRERETEEKNKIQEIQDLNLLKEKIDNYITENSLDSQVKTVLTSEGLLLTILDNALFYSGSAVVRPDAQQLAKKISELLLTNPPRQIVIAGHTDNVPINNSQFRSNWDLSAIRALNFMKILLDNNQLDPSYFRATGYGEYQPVDTNETEIGKARNRRVEVLILPNFSLE